jgi:hypothetical protein
MMKTTIAIVEFRKLATVRHDQFNAGEAISKKKTVAIKSLHILFAQKWKIKVAQVRINMAPSFNRNAYMMEYSDAHLVIPFFLNNHRP